MRLIAALVFALICTAALASDPGQPLDCSDWVFVEPGHACTSEPADAINPIFLRYGSNKIVDNTGAVYVLHVYNPANPNADITGPPYSGVARTELLKYSNGQESVVAWIQDRDQGNGGLFDNVRPASSNNAPSSERAYSDGNLVPNVISFDAVNGRILIAVQRYCDDENFSFLPNCPPGSVYGGGWQIVQIDGFTPLFDILDSYAPQSGSLRFRVPVRPEGMPGADHFDTYSGPLTNPINFTTAQPLACNYPAAAPHVGDFLTVADPLPDPLPGTGRYYVTSATYQGATRYGRQRMNHVTTGRDPALLPACTQ